MLFKESTRCHFLPFLHISQGKPDFATSTGIINTVPQPITILVIILFHRSLLESSIRNRNMVFRSGHHIRLSNRRPGFESTRVWGF
jgi:hypothetical protein